MAQLVKNLPVMRKPGFDPWVGKIPGERKGYLLQYSGLENSMDYTQSMGSQRVGHTERLSLHLPYVAILSSFS